MAFWNRKKKETRELTFVDTEGWVPLGGNVTATPDNVIGVPAVFSAVNILSTNVAKLNLQVFKVAKDGSRQLDNAHSVAKMMRIRVNPYQSSFDFLRLAISHYLLWGNAYIDLVHDGRGNVVEMWLLPPQTTSVETDYSKGEIYYRSVVPLTNESIVRKNYEIIHLKHHSTDGFKGKSPISCASDMLTTQMSINKYAKKFFEKGTMTTQVIKSPEFLNKESKDNIRNAWESANSGLDNAHRIAILDGGLDIHSVGMPIKDMQFVEQQQFNLRQIASIFNIPAYLLGDNGGLKYSNMEQQSISFIRDCLSPILTMVEQEFMYKLFKPTELSRYALDFDTSELLAGDSLTRAQVYEKLVKKPIMSVNEARQKEGLNPVEGGDELAFESSDDRRQTFKGGEKDDNGTTPSGD